MTGVSLRLPRIGPMHWQRLRWTDGLVLLLACKPLADAVSERSRDTQLDVGTAWTALALVGLVIWLVLPRTARLETWSLAASVITILGLGAIQMVMQAGTEALVESAKVAAGFAPAVILLDATRRPEIRRSLRRWLPVFVASLGVHVVVAWLQFFGLVSTTYRQAGVGRPSGLFFHPVTLGYVLVAALLVIAVLHQRRHVATWLALPLAGVVTLTIIIGTHRTSVIAALLVVGWWSLSATVRWQRVHLRSLVSMTLLTSLLVTASVVTVPLWIGAAERATSGVTSVVASGDLDPTSDRFLRGRGQRWDAALETMATASVAERIVGFGYQVVDPHSDYLRLPLVHGMMGSLLVLIALGCFWLSAFRQTDTLGTAWLTAALAVMAIFAITTKPTSYPSFIWAWTVVAAVTIASRRDAQAERPR